MFRMSDRRILTLLAFPRRLVDDRGGEEEDIVVASVVRVVWMVRMVGIVGKRNRNRLGGGEGGGFCCKFLLRMRNNWMEIWKAKEKSGHCTARRIVLPLSDVRPLTYDEV